MSSDAGKTWDEVPAEFGGTSSVLSMPDAPLGTNDVRVQCRVTNTKDGVITETVYSEIAVLTVLTPEESGDPIITEQPEDITAGANETATFHVTAQSPDDGKAFRCVVTNTKPGATPKDVFSEEAILTVDPELPIITQHPADVTVQVGESATFTAMAESPNGWTLNYEWEYSTDSGVTYQLFDPEIYGEDATSYTIESVTEEQDGMMFVCFITNSPDGTGWSDFVYTNPGQLTVTSAEG